MPLNEPEKFMNAKGVLPEDFISSSGYFAAIEGAKLFANQQLAEYKAKLKERINWLDDDGYTLSAALLRKEIENL